MSLIRFGSDLEQFIRYLRENNESYNRTYLQNGGIYSIVIAGLMIFLGIVMIVMAYVRYTHVEQQFKKRYYSYKWLSVLVVLLMVVGGGFILFQLIVHSF